MSGLAKFNVPITLTRVFQLPTTAAYDLVMAWLNLGAPFLGRAGDIKRCGHPQSAQDPSQAMPR